MKRFTIYFTLILALILNSAIAESCEISPAGLFKKGPSAKEELDSIYAEKNMGYDLAYGYFYFRSATYYLIDFDKSIATTLIVHYPRRGNHVSVSPRNIITYNIIGDKETGWHIDGTGSVYILSDDMIEEYSMKTHEKKQEFHVWEPETAVKFLRKGLSNESASSALKRLLPKSK